MNEIPYAPVSINLKPTECNICGGKVTLTDMVEVGIKPFGSGKCYYCTDCGAYVGTHKTRYREAMGILADAETRRLRARCHAEFDRHYGSITGRRRCYYYLSVDMGIKKEDCHIGFMDKEQLKQVLELMKTEGWRNRYIR